MRFWISAAFFCIAAWGLAPSAVGKDVCDFSPKESCSPNACNQCVEANPTALEVECKAKCLIPLKYKGIGLDLCQGDAKCLTQFDKLIDQLSKDLGPPQ